MIIGTYDTWPWIWRHYPWEGRPSFNPILLASLNKGEGNCFRFSLSGPSFTDLSLVFSFSSFYFSASRWFSFSNYFPSPFLFSSAKIYCSFPSPVFISSAKKLLSPPNIVLLFLLRLSSPVQTNQFSFSKFRLLFLLRSSPHPQKKILFTIFIPAFISLLFFSPSKLGLQIP